MAVTLYRCTKCRGLFNSVWDTAAGRLCRDCKLQTLGYQPNGGDPAAQQVKIVEDDMGGGKSGISGAIGGAIGDAQGEFGNYANQQLSASQQSLANAALSGLSGTSAAGQQAYDFKFSGWKEFPEAKVPYTPAPKSEPESSPHEAILKPSRKIRLQE